jgi:CRISPR-associated endonuclease/helicase Cas3
VALHPEPKIPVPAQRPCTFVAHAFKDASGAFRVHGVGEHLTDVADRAAGFASAFGSADWARAAGMWHDIGKYHPEFQRYIAKATGYDSGAHLEGSPGRVDHSTLGAAYALSRMPEVGRILAYVIAGHHTGLPDYESEDAGDAGLRRRVEKNVDRLGDVIAAELPPEITGVPNPASRPPGGSVALWIRMLFSALVDADFLDTEAFMRPERAALRGTYPRLEEMEARFDAHMAEKAARLDEAGPLSPVNRARADVLRTCREKAALPPGLYSLTVPTGGGKTLSSLAWALAHARKHGKKRVIYVIPFTSIIEQTADVFRRAVGDAVLEHHSNLEPDRETPESRVAAENWDAPLIVTTGVQFWESLFAARPGRARKLHNLVDSVVVLDEAQTLPPEFLYPVLDVMRDLQAHYGVSFLLCTATQPALEARSGFDWRFKGLTGVREIIDSPGHLHRALKRVDLEVPADLYTPVTWDALADELSREHAALCIVNRRDDARKLYALLPRKSRVHLSALMCGKHRSRTIQRIRRCLAAGKRIHVVSTQLVEAGVDVDFPVVYRALAGLDSVGQAAGRCNREGRLERGRVVVFVPPRPAPAGLLRQAEAAGRQSLSERAEDPLSPERFRAYFEELYWMQGDRLDRHGILDLLKHGNELKIRFRTAAERFKLIPDLQAQVVVRHRNHRLIRELERLREQGREPDAMLRRSLQRFVVSIPRHVHGKLAAAREIEEWAPGVWVQSRKDLYDSRIGLRTDRAELYEPADIA